MGCATCNVLHEMFQNSPPLTDAVRLPTSPSPPLHLDGLSSDHSLHLGLLDLSSTSELLRLDKTVLHLSHLHNHVNGTIHEYLITYVSYVGILAHVTWTLDRIPERHGREASGIRALVDVQLCLLTVADEHGRLYASAAIL